MTRNQKISQKRRELRSRLFPDTTDADLWLRGKSTGFVTVPRGLSLILTVMDRLSKGKPVSATYLELWCRMYDECLINLKPREMAFHAGFSGQRAEQTWSERIKILQSLGFIKVQPGPEGAFSYAVVLNPYKVVKKHADQKTPGLDEATFNALLQRMSEIGAEDLSEPAPKPPPPLPPLPFVLPTVPPERVPYPPPLPSLK